jgi:ComF family protein
MFDHLLSIITPHECVGCQREGNVLCSPCATQLIRAKSLCYRCQAPSQAGATCQNCVPFTDLMSVYAVARYNQPTVKHTLWRLKFDRAQAAAIDIAQHLAAYAPTGTYVVVPAPTATVRARQRGYDQAALIAKALVRIMPSQYTYVPALMRLGTQRQLGNTREQRNTQLRGAFRVRGALPAGVTVLLVDDVITTGATLQSAAAALKQAGAARVEALVFAQA